MKRLKSFALFASLLIGSVAGELKATNTSETETQPVTNGLADMFDKKTFFSVLGALLVSGIIFAMFSHVLDHSGQKLTGAKHPDAQLGE